MRLPAISLALVLSGCAGLPLPEVNNLPAEVRERELHKDPRLEEFVERSRPIPAPGLHWRTSSVRVHTKSGEVWEEWLYVSGSW